MAKPKTVHYLDSTRMSPGALCGASAEYVSRKSAEVTCKRCRTKLGLAPAVLSAGEPS